MLDHFTPRHIPALFVACATTFGGMWPMFDAMAAMLEFGFPTQVAQSPAAQPVTVSGQARTTTLGLLMFTFYLQRKFDELDTVLAVMGTYAGLVDSVVMWKAGRPGKAAFRLVASLLIGAGGWAGMSQSR